MKKISIIAIPLMIVALISLPAIGQGKGDVVKGKGLWEGQSCKACHGPNGEGRYAGPVAGDGKMAEDWINQVRKPKRNMPSFTETQLNNGDITDMWAHMQTLSRPASFTSPVYTPAPGDLPGLALFNQKRCAACHGDGKGMVKNRFTDKGRAVTASEVIKQLRTPVAKMPSFASSQVSDEDAGQIADYLKQGM